jgi:hypothetical protein
MSLNDIQLPSALLEGLYGRSLVLTEQAGPQLQIAEEKPVNAVKEKAQA